MSFEPEQLEILKRRAEEDFKRDMADIERLQRRLFGAPMMATPPIVSAPRALSYGRLDPVSESSFEGIASSSL